MKNLLEKATVAILILIVMFVLIPLMVACITTAQILNVNIDNEWIGFWGAYTGAIFGGALTFLAIYVGKRNMETTLSVEKNIQKRQEKREICNTLISLVCDYNNLTKSSLLLLSESIKKAKENSVMTYVIDVGPQRVKAKDILLWHIKINTNEGEAVKIIVNDIESKCEKYKGKMEEKGLLDDILSQLGALDKKIENIINEILDYNI